MNSHDEILERMSGANPLPDVEMITDGQLAEMTLQVEEARRAGLTGEQPQALEPTRTRVRWMRPAVAFAAALLVAFAVIGAVSLTTGGESDVADQETTTAADTTPTSTTNTVEVPRGEWNPVLATTLAASSPEPAICPAGADPAAPGPPDQERPAIGGAGSTFDHHAGEIIYVDGKGDTWGFDVCTNTWTNLHPTGTPTGNISDGLVYDIDSDLTVSIEEDEVFVYDANSNTWENLANTGGAVGGPIGAAYDPVSGLIVTASPDPFSENPDDWLVQAYDVDTDTWHDLGLVPLSRETPCCTGIDLLGYTAELDRLILTTYVDDDEATLLLDPRTGEMAVHTIPTPVVNLGWPSYSYGQGETVYVYTADEVQNGRWTDVLCGFDSNEIAWTRCFTAPEQFPALKHSNFDAIVEDPINDRVLLIGATYFTSDPSGIDDVWAIDLDTGEWTEIVEPTSFGPATIEDLSGEFEAEEPTDPPQDTIDTAQPGEWNSILADATAGPTPSAAICPPDASPSNPGPVDQQRPTTPDDDHDGAFDRRMGRVMYVDTMQRTWAFDVCTNTWQDLQPEGIPIDESLVYDVDSDVTIALGPGDFSVYDAKSNEWTRPPVEVVGGKAPGSFWGVAYDPVSGLVITTSDDLVWTYDVETGRLTQLGFVPPGGQLAGYVASIDRLVFVADATVLVDPRTGETTVPATGAVPFAGWGWYDFFDAAQTVFIGADIGGAGEGCGFNPDSLAWDLCLQRMSPSMDLFASRVEDPINGRVVLIHYSRIQGRIIDAVWALDLQGQMIELLAPSE